MESKPEFTSEELLYIEKTMDVNTSYADKPMRDCAEKLILLNASNHQEEAKLIIKLFFEHGEAYLIMRSIRHKIEKWRKENFK